MDSSQGCISNNLKLMCDITGYGFISLMTKLLTYTVSEPVETENIRPSARRSLVMFYRMLEGFRASNLKEDTPISGFGLYDHTATLAASPEPQSQIDIDLTRYEHFCNMLLAICRVTAR